MRCTPFTTWLNTLFPTWLDYLFLTRFDSRFSTGIDSVFYLIRLTFNLIIFDYSHIILVPLQSNLREYPVGQVFLEIIQQWKHGIFHNSENSNCFWQEHSKFSKNQIKERIIITTAPPFIHFQSLETREKIKMIEWLGLPENSAGLRGKEISVGYHLQNFRYHPQIVYRFTLGSSIILLTTSLRDWHCRRIVLSQE